MMETKSKLLNKTLGDAPRKRSALCSTSGQSLIELALLTPILLLLLLGAIEIGRYAYYAILVGNAARAGAAYGSQSKLTANDPTGIMAAACKDFQGQNACSLTTTKAYLCQCDSDGAIGNPIDCNTGTCAGGQREVVSLQVTATGTFTSLFNYPGIPPSVTISRTATLRVQ